MSNLTKSSRPNSTEKTKVRTKFPRKMFTVSEDAIIIRCVALYGTDNWNLISQFLPGRSIRQLRERYNTYLKPGTLDTPWTPEEDILLSQKVKEFGKHWKTISQFFKGRNQNNIKNRWNFHLKGGEALKNINNNSIKEEPPKNINYKNLDNMNENINSDRIDNNETNNNYNVNNSLINTYNNSNPNLNTNDINDNKININLNININNNKNIDNNTFENDSNKTTIINVFDPDQNLKDTHFHIPNYNYINNINQQLHDNQDITSNQDDVNNEHLLVMPLLNSNQKNNDFQPQQSINSQAVNNELTEAFNVDGFEDFYNDTCSDVFNNFQFDHAKSNSNYDSEQPQIKKNE